MEIGIIGAGHVGLITGVCLSQHGHRVICADSDINKIESLKKGIPTIYEPDLDKLLLEGVNSGTIRFVSSIKEVVSSAEVIFISVGTPSTDTGHADISYVENVSQEIAKNLTEYRVIVEKSTVPVETGQKVKEAIERVVGGRVPFDVVSNPEFLREGSAINDTLYPDRIVIGVASKKAEEIMRKVYENFKSPILVTDINSAEIIKHASNSFLAMKISFINAVSNICELANADIAAVARGIGLDKRIGTNFLEAGLGYGGSCFPKDVDAFHRIAEELGYPCNLLGEVQKINKQQRELFIKKIEKALWVVKDKKVLLLGLSFKPDTDDMRESPAIYIAKALIAKGARLYAYDPKAMDKAKDILTEAEFGRDLYTMAEGADCIVIATGWKEFREMDIEKIKRLMKRPLIIDGRNIFDVSKMKSLGFEYLSMGRR